MNPSLFFLFFIIIFDATLFAWIWFVKQSVEEGDINPFGFVVVVLLTIATCQMMYLGG